MSRSGGSRANHLEGPLQGSQLRVPLFRSRSRSSAQGLDQSPGLQVQARSLPVSRGPQYRALAVALSLRLTWSYCSRPHGPSHSSYQDGRGLCGRHGGRDRRSGGGPPCGHGQGARGARPRADFGVGARARSAGAKRRTLTGRRAKGGRRGAARQVRLQSSLVDAAGRPLYRDTWHCAVTIVKSESTGPGSVLYPRRNRTRHEGALVCRAGNTDKRCSSCQHEQRRGGRRATCER